MHARELRKWWGVGAADGEIRSANAAEQNANVGSQQLKKNEWWCITCIVSQYYLRIAANVEGVSAQIHFQSLLRSKHPIL